MVFVKSEPIVLTSLTDASLLVANHATLAHRCRLRGRPPHHFQPKICSRWLHDWDGSRDVPKNLHANFEIWQAYRHEKPDEAVNGDWWVDEARQWVREYGGDTEVSWGAIYATQRRPS